jgi:hypothetical protein
MSLSGQLDLGHAGPSFAFAMRRPAKGLHRLVLRLEGQLKRGERE